MGEYIGLDVSMKDTAISVRRDGKRVWRGKCASDPEAIARMIRKHAQKPERVIFETGPLSVWFYHDLQAEGLPAICVDARHAKAALDMAANKTDANDADGLAHLAEVGFYREVRVKGFDSMLTRTLVAARTKLVRIKTEISNQIRGLMKTFGLILPAGKGSTFDARSLAQRAQARSRTYAAPDRRCASERGMSAANVYPRCRCRHRDRLCDGRGRSSQLPNVAIRRCLARPNHTSISIRPSRLQRAHLQARRSPGAKPSVRSGLRHPDPQLG